MAQRLPLLAISLMEVISHNSKLAAHTASGSLQKAPERSSRPPQRQNNPHPKIPFACTHSPRPVPVHVGRTGFAAALGLRRPPLIVPSEIGNPRHPKCANVQEST